MRRLSGIVFVMVSLNINALELIDIPRGVFTSGDPQGDANEIQRRINVQSFRLMRHEVTNAEFAAFVTLTHYITDPERSGSGWVWSQRWRKVGDASWRQPQGPRTPLADRNQHPVVQVSHRDAQAFCAHHQLRLPTEHEWEYAARGQTSHQRESARRYPWGNETPAQGAGLANFGTEACCAPSAADGYWLTAPVGSFPAGASPFGILDLAGNVWEWTTDRFPGQPDEVTLRGGGWGNNPYCLRVSYRHGNPPDIGLDMVGFRCAGDARSTDPLAK